MNEILAGSVYFGVVLSLAAYYVGEVLNKKFKSPLLNPLLIAVIIIIGFLLLTGTSYETYDEGAKYLT